jgi:phenylpyruvate tautomerase PptA (4-oxalocrotonate tautomerase family)
MPFIHIKSLPFQRPFEVAAVLEGLCRDFAQKAGIDIRHVHATWEFLEPGHYAVGGKTRKRQPPASHPLLVDLLSPDFNDARTIARMLTCVASSLARRAKVPRSNIFINHRGARSGMVFDAGRVERW